MTALRPDPQTLLIVTAGIVAEGDDASAKGDWVGGKGLGADVERRRLFGEPSRQIGCCSFDVGPIETAKRRAAFCLDVADDVVARDSSVDSPRGNKQQQGRQWYSARDEGDPSPT